MEAHNIALSAAQARKLMRGGVVQIKACDMDGPCPVHVGGAMARKIKHAKAHGKGVRLHLDESEKEHNARENKAFEAILTKAQRTKYGSGILSDLKHVGHDISHGLTAAFSKQHMRQANQFLKSKVAPVAKAVAKATAAPLAGALAGIAGTAASGNPALGGVAGTAASVAVKKAMGGGIMQDAFKAVKKGARNLAKHAVHTIGKDVIKGKIAAQAGKIAGKVIDHGLHQLATSAAPAELKALVPSRDQLHSIAQGAIQSHVSHAVDAAAAHVGAGKRARGQNGRFINLTTGGSFVVSGGRL